MEVEALVFEVFHKWLVAIVVAQLVSGGQDSGSLGSRGGGH